MIGPMIAQGAARWDRLRPAVREALAAGLAVAVIAACAGTPATDAPPSTSSPSAGPIASPTPTASTVAASPDATPNATLDVGIPTGDLPPGTYTARALEPRFTFTIGPGWRFDLYDDSRPDRAVLLLGKPEPDDEAIYFDVSASTADPTLVLTATFGRLRGVTLGAVEPATIGGAPGVRVDGSVGDDLGAPSIQVFGLAEHYEFRAGDRFRAFVVDVGDRAMYVIVESHADAFDAFLERATLVLDSVTFP